MIKSIEHIGIMVNDMHQSVEFYTKVLGFLISRKIEIDEFSAVFIEKDDSKIELMEYRGKNVPKRSKGVELKIGSIPLNDHISFSVKDIEDTVIELKKKGVKLELEPMQLEGGMKLASFKDPDGMLIELVEHPEQMLRR